MTDEEFQQLEENILSEGEVLSPLIVWGNIPVQTRKKCEQRNYRSYRRRTGLLQGDA